MDKFKLENNKRFYDKCVEEGKYPKDVIYAVAEELDNMGYEVVLMGNGKFVDVYDTQSNEFLNITTKRDIIDYATSSKEVWLNASVTELDKDVEEYERKQLAIMKDYKGIK